MDFARSETAAVTIKGKVFLLEHLGKKTVNLAGKVQKKISVFSGKIKDKIWFFSVSFPTV